MTQVLVIEEVGPTLNQIYAGINQWKRKKIKDSFRVLVKHAVQTQGIKPVAIYPVTIDCRLTFGKGRRTYDWENAALTVKLIQDALRYEGVLADDSLKYITGGRMWCVRGEKTMTQYAIREGNSVMRFS